MYHKKRMFTIIHIIVHLMCLFALFSCGASVRLWNGGDITPPTLISAQMTDQYIILMQFDEEVTADISDVTITSTVAVDTVTTNGNTIRSYTYHNNSSLFFADTVTINGNTIRIQLSQQTIPGHPYPFTATISDIQSNSVLIVNTVHGFNPDLPDMRISEFTCEGNKKNHDKVEIAILSNGNIAGAVLQQGGIQSYKNKRRVIFPPREVKTGDYVVVHFMTNPNPNPIPDIIYEDTSKTQSSHEHAIDTAWDIFSKAGGLANSNGSITLLSLVQGTPIDAVIYSTKKDKPNDRYRGFSTKYALQWADEISAANMWNKKKDFIMPSDALNPKDSTSTRSISRAASLKDTNTTQDWHITPTSGATFGSINNDNVYTPKARQ